MAYLPSADLQKLIYTTAVHGRFRLHRRQFCPLGRLPHGADDQPQYGRGRGSLRLDGYFSQHGPGHSVAHDRDAPGAAFANDAGAGAAFLLGDAVGGGLACE
jgi:hypothetical protein